MTPALKRSRFMLSMAIMFFWASEYAHVPYFTPYLNQLGFGASIIGIMTGTYGFTQMLVRIPLGIATDITGGYKQVVLLGTVFTTLSSFGLMFATSAWFIIFCRFLAGIAASTWIAFTVLYAAYFPPEESTHAMTNSNIFNNTGKVIAFILGTAVASRWGYRYPLVVSFAVGVAAILFALGLKEVPIHREPLDPKNLIKVFKNPGVLAPGCYGVVLQMVCQGTFFSFTSTVAEMLGASRLQIGFNTALFAIAQVLAGLLTGKSLEKKIGSTGSVIVGLGGLGLSCLIVALAPNIYVIYLAQIIGGFGNMVLMSILMSLSIRTVAPESKSTAMGIFQAVYGLGMTAGPVIMGRLADLYSYTAGYLLFAGICLAALLSAPLVLKKIYGQSKA